MRYRLVPLVMSVSLAAALALVWPAAETRAQDVPDLTGMGPPEETEPQARLRWHPSLSLTTLGYDSNVFNRPRDRAPTSPSTPAPGSPEQPPPAAAASTRSQGDWVAGLAASLAPVYRVGRARLSGVGGLVGNYFHQFTQERGIDATAGGRIDLAVSRARLHAFGQYANLRQRLNFEIDQRARRTEEQVGTGLDLPLGARTTLGLQVRRSTLAFAEDTLETLSLRETLNREDRVGAASFQYALTPLTMVVMTGEVGRHRFERSPSRDGDSAGVAAGLTFSRDALIEGQWSLGWRRVTLSDPMVPEFSGFTGSADLSTTVGVGTRIGLRGRRGVVFSADLRSPYYVQSSAGASLTQAFGERWEVGVRAERVRLAYVRALDDSEAAHSEYVNVFGGGLTVRLPAGWRVSVQADAMRRRASTDPLRSYDTTRISTVFTPRLRF